MPRILTSSDLDIRTSAPVPVVTPDGDFNRDGRPDAAIAGLYAFPGEGKKYFLLVGTRFSDPVRFETLHYEEADRPFYLHQAGTTGDADPKNQAFSASFCVSCETGFDFYWNEKTKGFDKKPWKPGIERGTRMVETAAEQLPDPLVDQALKLVGLLPDVQAFVAEVKARGGTLVARARPERPGSTTRAVVEVAEKTAEGETVYDRISVDLKKNRVVKRERRPSKAGKGKKR